MLARKFKTPKKYLYLAIILSVLIIVIVFSALINIWLGGNYAYVSDEDNGKKSKYSVCVSGDMDNMFFDVGGAENIKQTIKIIFDADRIIRMNYTLNGVYDIDETAEQSLANLHASYNTYLSNVGIDIGVLSPVFDRFNNEVIVNLYATGDEINYTTAPLFMLSVDEVDNLKNCKSNEVVELYNSKGFSCIMRD